MGNTTADIKAAAKVEYFKPNDWQNSRSFSPVVVSQGGQTIWLAGQTTLVDLDGHDIAGKFDEQVLTIFALLNKTLGRIGGALANIVTMTVFINDPRNGDRFIEIRRKMFDEGRYPASALVTVSNFARPGCLVEIQGVAVI